MEEAVTKAIAEAKDRHRTNKDSLERRMEAKWRERVEEDKMSMGAVEE